MYSLDPLSRKLAFVFANIILTILLRIPIAQAATFTVCASSCDYATLTSAFASVVAGSTLTIGASYASTTETFPLTAPDRVSVNCQNSGATIGVNNGSVVDFNVGATSTIQSCRFNNTVLNLNAGKSDIIISGNSFTASTTQSLNTFLIDIHSQQVTVTGNTLVNTGGYASGLLNAAGVNNLYITDNSFNIPRSVTSSGVQINLGGSSSTVEGNYIRLSPCAACGFVRGAISFDSGSATSSANFEHNTIFFPASCEDCRAVNASGWGAHSNTLNAEYDLYAAPSDGTGVSSYAYYFFDSGSPTSTFHYTNDYNAYVHIGFLYLGAVSEPIAAHSHSTEEADFKTTDTDATNDLELAPYSPFLDVEDTDDIGAYSAARGTTFHVNPTGIVDYVTVDATTTVPITPDLRNGNALILAAGDYIPITVSTSTWLTGNITITGAGAGSIVNGAASAGVLTMNGVNSSTISNLVVKNASTTSVIYTVTNTVAKYNGNTYNDVPGFGGSPNASILISSAPCGLDQITADGLNVTSQVGSATNDWSLIVAHSGGTRVTIIVPNNFINSAAAFNAACTGFGLSADQWVASVFTVSGGVFTYNAAAMAAAGVTVAPGFTDPPRLDRVVAGNFAGIKLNNANNNTISNVTSTANSLGFWFAGTSASTTISDSAITGSAIYDIKDTASGNNSLKNTSFDNTLSSVTSTGIVSVFYTTRGFLTTSGGVPLEGALVQFHDAANAVTTNLVTGSDGYTPYSGYLLAFTLTSSSILQTSGGYNPYTVSTPVYQNLSPTSLLRNLSTPRQTISLVMAPAPTNAPSSGGGGGSGGDGSGVLFPPSGNSASAVTPLVYSAGTLFKLPDDGNADTQEDSAVYYYGNDGKRHAFPNAKVYFTYYSDFFQVQIIGPSQLAAIPLGNNMTYHPGVKMVKFTTLSKVYVVQKGGILRWVTSEAVAASLYGSNWNTKIDDINDAFYSNYIFGTDVNSSTDFNPATAI